MNNVLRQIEIDLYSTTSYEVIKAQQGDKNSRDIEFILYNQGEPYQFSDNVFFRFDGHRGDGSSFSKNQEQACITRNGNHVSITLPEDILYYAGIVEAKLVMYELSEKSENSNESEKTVLSTIPFKISCIKNPCNENNLSEGELSIVTDLVFQMKEFSKGAQDVIDQAAESASKAKTSEDNAKTSEDAAKTSEENAATYKNTAFNKAKEAGDYATLAESFAHGGTNTRTDENIDNAMVYAKQAQSYALGIGNVRPNESIENAKYYSEQAKNALNSIPSNEYMAEHFVPDYVTSGRSVNAGISEMGWYRIAESEAGVPPSCTINIDRRYNSPAPESQKIQLLCSHTKYKFVSVAALSNVHMWKKIRLTKDNSKFYIEIFQDRESLGNVWFFTICDAINNAGKWKAITPVKTEETVSGVTVLASLDLPANFDLSNLLNKNGDTVNGYLYMKGRGIYQDVPDTTAGHAQGISWRRYNQSAIEGGIGAYGNGDAIDYIYAAMGTATPWVRSAGLSISASDMKWKNSKVVTENSGTAYQSTRDGNGNVIPDTYVKKEWNEEYEGGIDSGQTITVQGQGISEMNIILCYYGSTFIMYGSILIPDPYKRCSDRSLGLTVDFGQNGTAHLQKNGNLISIENNTTRTLRIFTR